MKKIFLCETIDNDAYILLSKHFDIINNIDEIKDCHGIIARNLKIDKDFIDQCLNLEIIAVHGTGYDSIDVEYLKEKNIHLFNTPHLNSLSVAELIVNMMITLSRHTYQLDRDLRDKKISTIAPIEYIGNEISYKTFGIIGTGDIALKTAKILKNGFHMNIIAYSRSLTNKKADELHITLCKSIDEVFQKSDFINIGVSLNKDTYHLITLEQFKLMKPSAYLINTSRGAIINEEDLYYALTNKLLNGYACDVLENEDLSIKQSLLELDNVFYTPHIGGSTHDCLSRIGHAIFISLVNYFDGKQISNMIC
jgi:Lactate dehydrogenase and related dehydrogenases